ncbi:hypothetical protein DNTS_018092 [Danionella cerebrum]|uniref:Complex 1 LYR protein domain-containing protein n=1 Tax=Danionella cerebrum TaxID=2873325 RepID=A0A553QGX0_9TELE|nr:hypothetical protein DNTS_018092 [Danionella translucida]
MATSGRKTYALRRVRDSFRDNKSVEDARLVDELLKKAQESLAIIRRQASQMTQSCGAVLFERESKPRLRAGVHHFCIKSFCHPDSLSVRINELKHPGEFKPDPQSG